MKIAYQVLLWIVFVLLAWLLAANMDLFSLDSHGRWIVGGIALMLFYFAMAIRRRVKRRGW